MLPPSPDTKRLAPLLLCFTAIALLIVWPINGTTGLKNVLLLLGTGVSVRLLLQRRVRLQASALLALSPALAFFCWMLVQALWISPYRAIALHQVNSVWIAVLLAAFLGAMLGQLCSHDAQVRRYTLLGLQLFPFVYLLNFIGTTIELGHFSIPIDWDHGIYRDKIKIVFFGLIAMATAITQVTQYYAQPAGRRLPWFSLACIFMALASFLMVGTKTGVLQSVLLAGVVAALLLQQRLSRRSLLLFLLAALTICAAAAWQVRNDKGWNNFFKSVEAGMDIEHYDNWQDYPAKGLPKFDGVYETQESSYLRGAGARLGLLCLSQEPLGTGHLSEPLRYTRDVCAVMQKTTMFTTYSAIMDFTVVVGYPGALFFFGFFVVVILRRQEGARASITLQRLVPVAMLITWALSEVTETHYYESTMFVLALLSTLRSQAGEASA